MPLGHNVQNQFFGITNLSLQQDDGMTDAARLTSNDANYRETVAMKSVLNALLLGSALVAFSPAGLAQSAVPQAKPQAKPNAKAHAGSTARAKSKSKAAKEDGKHAHAADVDADVDVTASVAVEMKCAHDDQVTLYQNANDNSHIAMRWKKQLLRMDRVETTTGADRFESKRHGLLWIGIPAKGMLLDSRKGKQLANDCRSPAQLAAQATQREPAEPLLLGAR